MTVVAVAIDSRDRHRSETRTKDWQIHLSMLAQPRSTAADSSKFPCVNFITMMSIA